MHLKCSCCEKPIMSWDIVRLEAASTAFLCRACDQAGRLWAAKNAFLLKMSEDLNALSTHNGGPYGGQSAAPGGPGPQAAS